MPTQRSERLLAPFLALQLALPPSAFALRIQAGLESTTHSDVENSLHASSGTDPDGQRINKRLEELLGEAKGYLPEGWMIPAWFLNDLRGTSPVSRRLRELMFALLEVDSPKGVRQSVQRVLGKVDKEILVRIPESDQQTRRYVQALPQAADWLRMTTSALYPPEEEERFRRHQQALADYSQRAAALAFGRIGPHLRERYTDTDRLDLETAPLLLMGFLPLLDRRLRELERSEGSPRRSRQIQKETREYAGALWNGLMILQEDDSAYREYRTLLVQAASRGRLHLEQILWRSAQQFPDLLPSDPPPGFLLFYNQAFSDGEIEKGLIPYNQGLDKTQEEVVSLWDLTVGNPSAEPYIEVYGKLKEKGPKGRYLKGRYQSIREFAGLKEPEGEEGGKESNRRALQAVLQQVGEEALTSAFWKATAAFIRRAVESELAQDRLSPEEMDSVRSELWDQWRKAVQSALIPVSDRQNLELRRQYAEGLTTLFLEKAQDTKLPAAQNAPEFVQWLWHIMLFRRSLEEALRQIRTQMERPGIGEDNLKEAFNRFLQAQEETYPRVDQRVQQVQQFLEKIQVILSSRRDVYGAVAEIQRATEPVGVHKTGLEEARALVNGFVRALVPEESQGLKPVVVGDGLEKQHPELKILAGLEELPVVRTAGREPVEVALELISRWDARRAFFVGLEEEAQRYVPPMKAVGIETQSFTPEDATHAILAILAQAAGLEEAALADQKNVGRFLDDLTALATVRSG